jgi:glycosyltransferase involved in cell wall biosynthesis
VLDDGSTDGTRELVTGRYGRDDRVRYHYTPNGGVSAARNAAMALARGEILVFADSDDLWKPERLPLQMAAFERFPDVELVWTDVTAVDANGTVLHERYTRVCYPAWHEQPMQALFQHSEPIGAGGRVYVGNIFATMLKGTLINMPSVAVRSRVIARVGQFDSTMATGEDYDFNLRVSQVGKVAFIDTPTVLYRTGAADQLTHESLHADQARNWFRSFERFRAANLVSRELTPVDLRRILAGKYRWLGHSELAAGNRADARAAFWKSVVHGGSSLRLWLTLLSTLLPEMVAKMLLGVYHQLKSTARTG